MSRSTVPRPYPSHCPCPNHLLQHWSPHYWWRYQDDSWELCFFLQIPYGCIHGCTTWCNGPGSTGGKNHAEPDKNFWHRVKRHGLHSWYCLCVQHSLHHHMFSLWLHAVNPFLYIPTKVAVVLVHAVQERSSHRWLITCKKTLSKAFYALMTNDVSTTMSSYVIMKQSLTMQPVLTPVHSVLIKSAARCLDLSPC